MQDYPDFLAEGVLGNMFDRPALRDYWMDNFGSTHKGLLDTWDYQWVYHNFKNDRLAVVPNCNMIRNIGFGRDATHTAAGSRAMPGLDESVSHEMAHPLFVVPDRKADDFTYRVHLRLGCWFAVKQFVKRLTRRIG
jgi:hypothetical protein